MRRARRKVRRGICPAPRGWGSDTKLGVFQRRHSGGWFAMVEKRWILCLAWDGTAGRRVFGRGGGLLGRGGRRVEGR